MRRSLLSTALVYFVCASPHLHFMLVGDWGGKNPQVLQVARAMGRIADNLSESLAAIISTGDNFYMRGPTTLTDPRWKTVFEEQFVAYGLQRTPWLISLGQHDHAGDVGVYTRYQSVSKRWEFPSRYYTRAIQFRNAFGETESVQFFVLDSYSRDLETTQFTWLQRALSKSVARWRFIVGHQPVVTSGSRKDPHIHRPTKAVRTRIFKIMDRFGVQAYFSGDNHFLELLQVAHKQFVISGGGCGSPAQLYSTAPHHPQSLFAASVCGFTVHRVTHDYMKTTVFDLHGSKRFRHFLWWNTSTRELWKN
eukprot:TRINITY_DN26149_c0_g1_i1.p1 TRINITY_DN26149_c0_g1~~TRINITY_DN26149_c0_g1_i1.p1  ORF type:complete len:307 (-),score=15.11 TRINITY_DN26149_c0_g1_i1:2-922(-)